MRIKFLFFIWVIFIFSCKTVPPKTSGSILEFQNIEGNGIYQVTLFYNLKLQNTHSAQMDVSIEDWNVFLQGEKIDSRIAILKIDDQDFSMIKDSLKPGQSVNKKVELSLDLNKFLTIYDNFDKDSFTAELSLETVFKYSKNQKEKESISVTTEFPQIKEPEFTIVSIAILKAELINTRFRVQLEITNPNPFPISLYSFDYELYGHDLYWAGGSEKNILEISAKESKQTNLFLMMNFINMKRSLLDEIIAYRKVKYRFSGSCIIGTSIDWMPKFDMIFDKSGFSEVFE
jgi:LEA14-like dessication related protein